MKTSREFYLWFVLFIANIFCAFLPWEDHFEWAFVFGTIAYAILMIRAAQGKSAF